MKFLPYLVLSFLSSCAYCVAIQGDASQAGVRNGRIEAPPNAPPQPNPLTDNEIILPGRSGWYMDPQTKTTTIHYGDDWLPGHMRHLDRNQQKYPSNRDVMRVHESGPNHNRPAALAGIDKAPNHPVSDFDQVLDEKLPNMFINPHHKTQTTVEHRELSESSGVFKGIPRPSLDHSSGRLHSATNYVSENGLLSSASTAIRNKGNKYGMLRSNPGWLPLDPKQAVAHEAPGRMQTPPVERAFTTGSGSSNGKDNGSSNPIVSSKSKGKRRQLGTQVKSEAKPAHQRERKAGGKTLRPLTSAEPATQLSNSRSKPQKPSKGGPKETNLQDGTPARLPGYVLRADKLSSQSVSHFGAPRPEQGSETRRPPRPQNLQAYRKQLLQANDNQSKHANAQAKAEDAAARAGVLPGSTQGKDQKYLQNLQRFNSQYPVQSTAMQSGRASEAPARLDSSHHRIVADVSPHSPPSSPPPPGTPSRIPIRSRTSAQTSGAGQGSSGIQRMPNVPPPPEAPSRIPIRSRTGQQNLGAGQGNPGVQRIFSPPNEVSPVAGPSTPTRDSEGPRRNPARKATSRSQKLRRRWFGNALHRRGLRIRFEP